MNFTFEVILWSMLCGFSFYYLFLKIKEYTTFKRLLKDFEKQEIIFEKIKYSTIYRGWMIFSIVVIVALMLLDNQYNIIIYFCLITFLFAEFINANISLVFYYNDKQIVVKGKLYRIKDIIRVNRIKTLFIKSYDIQFKKGITERVNNKIGDKIIELSKK